jgi:MFS family permease
MTGFGCAFGFICLLVAVYEWMPHKHIGLFIGLSQFIGTMGPMVAAGPLDSLAQNSPGVWREVFFGLFVIGSIIAILGLFFVKNNKPQTGSFQILSPYTSWKDDLADLFKQKQVWWIALYAATVYFVIEYLSENSGIKYMELNGIDSDVASYMITLSWIGYAVGCPILGSISDRTGRRKNVMIAAAICGIISTAVIIYLPISAILLMIAFFGMGVGASGQSISFATIAERCTSRYRAAGLGLNNGVMLAFVSFSAPFIGYILSLVTQSGQSPTVADYQQAFIFIIGFMIVALFASIFLVKETYCKSTRETTILETR